MRFEGTVQRLDRVDVRDVVRWVSGIPWEAWPQQDRLADGAIRPAMVNDLRWQGFGAETLAMVLAVQALMPVGLRPGQRLLSVVMPGHSIPAHVDRQAPDWFGRVHVPLMTDPASAFVVDGWPHHLDVGWAYVVNTLREHSVTNAGGILPRVHFMVDFHR